MMVMRVEEEEEEEGNWSELPYHVLHEIMDRFSGCGSTSDYISCGDVCVSWRTAFNNHRNPSSSCIVPLLMLPSSFSTFTFFSYSGNIFFYQDDAKNKKKYMKKKQLVRRFYNISNEKVDDILKVRMSRYSDCRGSSHGWLIIVDAVKPYHVRLFNPFFSPSSSSSSSSPEGIVLPCLEKYESLHKAVLSADPISNPTNYIVMIIYGGTFELEFHKSGDKGWTRIKSPSIKDHRDGFFDDVIYYQNKFFAIHGQGTVVVCDDLAAGSAAAARVLLEFPKPDKYSIKTYLVESSSGDLLQVHRDVFAALCDGRLIYSTIGFRVFKLLLLKLLHNHHHHHSTKAQKKIATTSTLEHSDYEWVEVKNLCGDTLFLGKNASISIPTSEYDDHTGCKPNSIYYTDDSDFYTCSHPNDGPHDIGIFNLEDGTFQRYYTYMPIPIWPVPIWIQLDTSSLGYKRRISSAQMVTDVQDRFNT